MSRTSCFDAFDKDRLITRYLDQAQQQQQIQREEKIQKKLEIKWNSKYNRTHTHTHNNNYCKQTPYKWRRKRTAVTCFAPWWANVVWFWFREKWSLLQHSFRLKADIILLWREPKVEHEGDLFHSFFFCSAFVRSWFRSVSVIIPIYCYAMK